MEIAENARPLNKDVAIQIGQRIQSCRLEKAIKAIDLATAIGIGKDQLSRIENGRVVCTTENLFLIAQYLNVSFDFLLFGKDLSSPQSCPDAYGRVMWRVSKALYTTVGKRFAKLCCRRRRSADGSMPTPACLRSREHGNASVQSGMAIRCL